MAEDEDGASNKKSLENDNDKPSTKEKTENVSRPDLANRELSSNDNETESSKDKSSPSKSSDSNRKEDNTFSLRHFLKRDLSLPSSSSYEPSGSKPKAYAQVPQNFLPEESSKSHENRPSTSQIQENTQPSSSNDIPVSNSHSNRSSDSEGPYQRSNLVAEAVGMPSLPDFVQDHLLLDQAYESEGEGFDNPLPDFTFNTGMMEAELSHVSNLPHPAQHLGFNGHVGREHWRPSRASERSQNHSVPVDRPPHWNLDLTESVNQPSRRFAHDGFPLDLPQNSVESLRLPDFLPPNPGRTTPEADRERRQMQHLLEDLDTARSELSLERSNRVRLEHEITQVQSNNEHAQREVLRLTQRIRDLEDLNAASTSDGQSQTVLRLQKELEKLKSDYAKLKRTQQSTMATLRRATNATNASLRELIQGLQDLEAAESQTEDP